MGSHGLDAACITDPISIAYLSGFRADTAERLMAAAVATDRVTEAVLGWMRGGQPELEVSTKIAELAAAAGCVLSFPGLVQSGPNSALPHLMPSERRLQPGDLVLLDFGASCEGYKG